MKKPAAVPAICSVLLSPVPGWMRSARAVTLEDGAFLTGAALARLHPVASQTGLCHSAVPCALWRERLALTAAEACVAFAGRPERAPGLRDALHFLRPGDNPGPAGAVFGYWRQAVGRKVTGTAFVGAVPDMDADRVARILETDCGSPAECAAAALEAVLADTPRAETAALMLGDAALARALGWDRIVPLLAAGMQPRDLHKRGSALRLACCRAIVTSAQSAFSLAADLTRRAAALQAVAPSLRAKGAQGAVALFLSQDALAPTGLSGILPDRAARRLCDRLVALGAVRELTGRATFRLYGL